MSANTRTFHAPVTIVIRDPQQILFEGVFETYPVVIGRSTTCQIPLPSVDYMSRQHVAILEDEHGLAMVDLNSSNGFTFNGQRLRRLEIKQTVSVRIGMLTMEVRPASVRTETNSTGTGTPYVKLETTISNLKFSADEKTDMLLSSAGPVDPDKTQVQTALAHPPVPRPPNLGSQTETAVPTPSIPRPAHGAWPTAVEPRAVPVPLPAHVLGHQAGPAFGQSASPASHSHSVREALLAPTGIEIHPLAGRLKANERVLEGIVTWHDEVYDMQEFYLGERVSVGVGSNVGLELPSLNGRMDFAIHERKGARCYVPRSATVEILRGKQTLTMPELLSAHVLTRKGEGYVLRLADQDLMTVDLDGVTKIHFRYAPLPKRLTKKRLIESDEELRTSTLVSGFVHTFIAILAVLSTPTGKQEVAEQTRSARLVMMPPTVKTPDLPPPKPPEQKERIQKIKKERKKLEIAQKVQPKPKKVVIHQPKMKLPEKTTTLVQVKGPPTPVIPKPEVNVQALGALAALSALPSATPSNIPASININKNAGGKPGPTTNSLLSALSTKGGKMGPAGGMGTNLKVKGLGYGTGTGYGTAGLSGKAGNRGIAGAVIGQPKLMKLTSQEGLTQAQVMEIVKKHLTEIQQCYERSMISTPGLAGRVEYEWDITPRGIVTDVRVKKSEMNGGDALNSCVSGVFKKMKFPVAKNGQNTTPNIGFPFGRL